MIDISVHDLNKYYGSNHVLKGISLEINSGEKVGLLGKNGSGKTTLFKIIAENEYYESGSVSKALGRKVEMLSQTPDFGESDTTEDVLYSSFNEVLCIYKAMKKIEGDANTSVLARYGQLMEEYERLGGYDIEVKIEKICNGMNIDENMRKSRFSLLSGGEKTRVNLARILLRDCDILLLDEPTNHLDLTTLVWLENFLREFAGTIVVISHDRTFLDNVIKRVIEIEDGTLNFYGGNYSFYVEEKERRIMTQAEQYKQQQRKINRLESTAKMLFEGNRFGRRHVILRKRIEMMEKVEKPKTTKNMTEGFNSGGYASKENVSLELVSKSYGAKVLLDKVSLSIRRNDCIAVIGPNGCGKTTLLRMIMGEESSDSGVIKVSSNVKIAYMPQIICFEDENATVLDTLRMVAGLPEDKLRSILVGFRFIATDVMKKVANLSGGEKSRLKLCLLMQDKVNFLILDEPTNHLDINSREWIEDAIADFDGALLMISHDRYFLSRFATRIWSMENGTINDFCGSFDDYLSSLATLNQAQADKRTKNLAIEKKKPKIKEQTKPPIKIELLIAETEAEIKGINELIEQTLSNQEYATMDELYKEKQRLDEQLDRLYNEWLKENESK